MLKINKKQKGSSRSSDRSWELFSVLATIAGPGFECMLSLPGINLEQLGPCCRVLSECWGGGQVPRQVALLTLGSKIP